MEKTFILADNQDITRLGWYNLISSSPDAADARIDEVRTRKELVERLAESPYAIVILDSELFGFKDDDDLFALIQQFHRAQWILFSHELSESFIRRFASEANISILFKESDLRELNMVISYNLRRERFLSQCVTNILLTALSHKEVHHENLTATEIEILKLIAQGKSVKEIAAVRYSSVHTITTHKKNIFRKINVNTIYDATRYALRSGLVDMVEYYI